MFPIGNFLVLRLFNPPPPAAIPPEYFLPAAGIAFPVAVAAAAVPSSSYFVEYVLAQILVPSHSNSSS